MKFKILKGTDTYNKLREFDSKIKKQNSILLSLMKEFGADAFSPPANGFYNSKLSFQFKKGKPEGWKNYDKSMDLYVPKVNTIFDEKIKELPELLDFTSAKSIINFEINLDSPISRFTTRPTIYFVKSKELYIVSTGNGYYECEDMIEILESEFNKLAEII